MFKNNKTCALCSTKYTYCNTCKDFSNLPVWMNMFDTENCKNIYFACADYYINKNINSAKSVLEKCDLSKKHLFSDKIQREINEIMGDNTSEIRSSLCLI